MLTLRKAAHETPAWVNFSPTVFTPPAVTSFRCTIRRSPRFGTMVSHRGRGCAPMPIGAQRARTGHRRAMVPLERWALERLESRRLLASGHAHVQALGHGWARLGARSA